MPNGIERYLFKVLAVVEAYHRRFRIWPVRLRIHPDVQQALERAILTESGYCKLADRLEVVVDDTRGIVAESRRGWLRVDVRRTDGVPRGDSADRWLGLTSGDYRETR